ncbi:MAG: pilus (MSHA type) biogenesis protein MshL [Helicobacter sp.]|nr:pilus (MSHA type) biogenesis protein MshL [Helicobacteraceae bacterium]MDY3113824.1 pilus (MSHA type) biogenesis protein MshL [Helicobacter sp.]
MIIKRVKFALLALFLNVISLFSCENRLFDLELQSDSVKIGEVLNEFSRSCNFSVIFKDSSSTLALEKNLSFINFKEKDLEFVFDLLFTSANLNYEFRDDILILQSEATKTFNINYLSTKRQGKSSTSVAINNEEKGKFSDDSKSDTSKSGIEIISEDGFNFWENIENEILALLNAKKEENRLIINQGAGLISVRGDRNTLKKVESYINNLHNRLQKQVLIDVQILSVRHSDINTMGINWDSLYNLQNLDILPFSENGSLGGDGASVSGLSLSKIDGKKTLNYGINIFSQGVSLNRVIEFLKSYGSVRSISNPKVLTLNNQPALISVGDILRYKKSNVYQNTNAQTTLTNTDDEYPSIFAGVLLDITPLVFKDSIMLKVNPSITRTKDEKTRITSLAFDTPPNLTTNQLSSIVKVKNNEKVILGGLIAKNLVNTENKIPLLGDIPLISPLFSYKQTQDLTEEIVFIIEPKIIDDSAISLESLGYSILEYE